MLQERPRYGGGTVNAGLNFGLGIKQRFDLGPCRVEHGGDDFFGTRSYKVQFADPDASFGTDGRAERAAGDGAGSIEVACACSGIQSWAWFVVREVVEAWIRLIQLACNGVTGKVRRQAADRFRRTPSYGIGPFRSLCAQSGEAFAKTRSVELRDAEDPHTALGAPETAMQPVAGATGGVGCGCVYDLNQVLVLWVHR